MNFGNYLGAWASSLATPPASQPQLPEFAAQALTQNGDTPGVITEERATVPNYMAGINDALAQNEAIGAERAAKGGSPIGKFLLGWAGHLGDTLTGNPVYAKQMLLKQELEGDEKERRRRAMLPQQIGNSMVVPDGMGGFRTVYSAPTDAERYAGDLGLQRGSPEWANAIREYRAPAWSPWALEGKEYIENVRFGHRGELQDDRQEYGRSMQEDRQSHSDAQLGRRLQSVGRGQDLRSRDTRRGQDMTDSRARAAGRGRAADRSDLIGPVYQKSGRRVQYSRKAGGYIDLETGKRVN